MRRSAVVGVLIVALAGTVLGRAGKQGVGQTPSSLPLSQTIRERGTSVTPAYEGWYYDKDGSIRLLVGYFNRNTKQEFDIPAGPNNRIEPGGPDQGQPTHFQTGRQWGVLAIKVPKEFGQKKLTWTIVANGFTNSITLHTQADYVVEPFEDAASKNTPPKIMFQPGGPAFTGPPTDTVASYTTAVNTPLALTTWVTDEGPKINVPETTGRGRGRGRGRGTGDAGAAGASGATGATGGRGPRGDLAALGLPEGFTPPPPIAVKWAVYRQPAGATVKFDPAGPPIDKDNGGKNTTNATFGTAGEYTLRVQVNDSTGEGGGGFQCCWSNAYVKVNVTGGTK
ncbi:MAG: hypothetical protein DMG02_16015 [Acidobacteria bacterium]|nr:MAG: hypothetical protein DMG02_16015 [Acidobacteriota bacterium]